MSEHITVSSMTSLVGFWILLIVLPTVVHTNHDAQRLYDDLLVKKNYNRLIRPVEKNDDILLIKLGLRLSQLTDVDEKNQIMTTNMWVIQEWRDFNLQWDPREYGGVNLLYVPSELIWLPDIVLYNNADGDYTVTMRTKATLYYNGMVRWEPPSTFKSQCDIKVEFFPFDEQLCQLKFGSWTYEGEQVDLRHILKGPNTSFDDTSPVNYAIEMSQYYPSVEFDVMDVLARKNIKTYPCCNGTFPDVTFNITIRRKTLYYTYTLIIPCVSINMLTVVAFYLPSHCGEKISISISILLSLSIFQLLLMDLVPATSVKLSLMGRYILFTCVLVTLSIILSVWVLNINYRNAATNEMSRFTKTLFLETLPKLLMMGKPDDEDIKETDVEWTALGNTDMANFGNPYKSKFKPLQRSDTTETTDSYQSNFIGFSEQTSNNVNLCEACAQSRMKKYPPNIRRALEGTSFIAGHLQADDRGKRVKDEWRYVALVFDRLLLWIYVAVCIVGGMGILLNAPVLYDGRMSPDWNLMDTFQT